MDLVGKRDLQDWSTHTRGIDVTVRLPRSQDAGWWGAPITKDVFGGWEGASAKCGSAFVVGIQRSVPTYEWLAKIGQLEMTRYGVYII